MATDDHLQCIPARRLKTHLKEIVEGTAKGTHTLITHNDQPVAIIMPIDVDKYHDFLLKKAPDYVIKPDRKPRERKAAS